MWPDLHARDPAHAAALLEWAAREGQAAGRAEPRNWRIEHGLARLWRAAAATGSGYEDRARRHLARARALAPGRAVFAGPLEPPASLAARRLADGRVELRWRPSPGAGYHQIARSAGPGVWSVLLYSYEPGRSSFIAPGGPVRYRIKACRRPPDCSAWVKWP